LRFNILFLSKSSIMVGIALSTTSSYDEWGLESTNLSSRT
jgi:hypothetical protein